MIAKFNLEFSNSTIAVMSFIIIIIIIIIN